MIDEPAAPAGKRPRSREQLLRLLHDDPRSVSRAEIKAAFADGRLGDQDLDIPVLAGMKRITELLAELDPNAAAPAPSRPEAGTSGSPVVAGSLSVSGAREASRASTTSVRVQDIEEHLGRLADQLAALEARVQEDRASAAARAAADDQAGQATARTVRMIAIALVIVAIVVVLQIGLRLANG